MNIYITFGDEKYRKACHFAIRTARFWGGFDKFIAYSPIDIDDEFFNNHADIFKISRGYGLWLWKPYFIYKTLITECKYGDYLFYCDAGAFLFRNIAHIIRTMDDNDVWIPCNPLQEWQFTKIDAFRLMNIEEKRFFNSAQAQASYICVRKSEKSIKFIKEWLDLCCDKNLLYPDNVLSKMNNPIGFVGHREDQSILSLLCKKNGVRFHSDPSQFGKYPEKYFVEEYKVAFIPKVKEYPVCIIHHRCPDLKLSIILRQAILVLLPRKIGLKLITSHFPHQYSDVRYTVNLDALYMKRGNDTNC